MKITLEKEEVEDAIKAFVASQIHIQEGQSVSVILGNGIATIDISNNIDNSTAPKVARGRPRKQTVEKIEPEASVDEQETEQEEEVVDNTPVEDLHIIKEPEVQEEPESTAEALAEDPTTEPPGPKRSSNSLFGNLTRPKND